MDKIKEAFEAVWKKRPWIVAHESDKDRAFRYFSAGFECAEKPFQQADAVDFCTCAIPAKINELTWSGCLKCRKPIKSV